ncbi:MAG: hypothetical protein ACLQUZ_14250 [Rhizomicrobium sp.]
MQVLRTVRRSALLCALVALATARPALAGPPFITDDPEPVDLGHWEVYAFSAGASGRGDTTGLGPSIEVNYGAAPGLQLHIIGGLSYDDRPGGHLNVGMGDTELGAKLRFVNPGEDDWYPQVGIFPLVEVPTGDAKRGLGAGEWQEFLPLWVQKDFGKWTTYGGGGYWINPGPGNQNYWFFGWLLQCQVTDDFALGAEVFHQTSSMIGRSASSGFNVGGIYDFTEHYHLLFSSGRGGTLYAVDTPAVGYPTTYYLAFQWTF